MLAMAAASEAQRLIGISLSKIAQSRNHRGGISLHKNLLVATVLQKARYIFMEEAYNMVQCASPPSSAVLPPPPPVAAAPATVTTGVLPPGPAPTAPTLPPGDLICSSSSRCHQDKENRPPTISCTTSSSISTSSQVMISSSPSALSSSVVSSEPVNNNNTGYLCTDLKGVGISAKRRRAVAEWETEEAVNSILPKRTKHESATHEMGTDFTIALDLESSTCLSEESPPMFIENAKTLSETVSKDQQQMLNAVPISTAIIPVSCSSPSINNPTPVPHSSSSMEIDRITSLVSIFSFSMGDKSSVVVSAGCTSSSGNISSSSSSSSQPDLCSTQAKEQPDGLQQRPFLAMTV